MRNLLEIKNNNLALVIGNGINRYNNNDNHNSWDALLSKLAQKYIPTCSKRPRGVSPTEFFDALELNASTKSLQTEFCDLIKNWKPRRQHDYITKWASQNDVPILTTNFDTTLSEVRSLKLQRTIKGKFTAYYPWESYYGVGTISDATDSFAIWHINGCEKYRQSIRLGLSHYMGSVQRARNWLHRGGEKRLFSGNSHDAWKGSKTWLRVMFSSDLLIFGLELGQDEVFLRWLFIERARYFKHFPDYRRNAWYVSKEGELDAGKHFFLDSVGVKTVVVSEFDDIYGEHIWRL